MCVCVSVCPSVCPPFFSVTAATPSVKRGHRRHARENKILERKRPGKLVKRTAAEVSVRQIEIVDDRCTLLCACGEDLLVCLY